MKYNLIIDKYIIPCTQSIIRMSIILYVTKLTNE